MRVNIKREDLERVLQNLGESISSTEKTQQRRIVVLTDNLQQMVRYRAQITRFVEKLDEEFAFPEQTVVFVADMYNSSKKEEVKKGDYVIYLSHYFNNDCLQRLRQNIRDGLPLRYSPPVFSGCMDVHGE